MKNLSIWAWMPEDYNPQGKQLSFMQIRQQVQLFNLPPKSLGMTSPLGWLALTISDWAREEQRDGNNDEALESYEDLDSETEKRGYFYIEYLPDDNFHEFHAMLIETATKKGLIVLSDFSEAVFYPDSTSEPAMAFQAIQESREEERQASSNAMWQTLDDFLGEWAHGYVENEKSLEDFVHLTLQDYLDKKRVKYSLKKTFAEVEWQDCKINISILVSYYLSTGIIIDDGYTTIIPNETYKKDFLIYQFNPEGKIKKFIKKNEYIRYSWRGLDTSLENPKFVEVRHEVNKYITTYKFHSNQIFYDYICFHLDTLFDFLNDKQSFFDIIDQMYQDKSGILNPFRVFRNTELKDLPNDDMTAGAVIGNLNDELSLLYLVNHPQTWNYFNQIQQIYPNYLAQKSPDIQEKWHNLQERWQDMHERLQK